MRQKRVALTIELSVIDQLARPSVGSSGGRVVEESAPQRGCLRVLLSERRLKAVQPTRHADNRDTVSLDVIVVEHLP